MSQQHTSASTPRPAFTSSYIKALLEQRLRGDPQFRASLRLNPRAAFREVTRCELPHDFALTEADNHVYLVIPENAFCFTPGGTAVVETANWRMVVSQGARQPAQERRS